jgi:protein-tyrosine phosphatase
MIGSILVLCVGNICRSPVGERLLQKHLPGVIVHSAGLMAVKGHAADETMQAVSEDHDLSLDGHIAKQYTSEMARSADIVLVMEQDHIEKVLERNMYLSGKVFLFDKWTGAKGIADPYRRSREYHVTIYEILDRAAEAWAKRLK